MLHKHLSGDRKRHVSLPDMLHPVSLSFYALLATISFDVNSEFHVKFKIANFVHADQNTD